MGETETRERILDAAERLFAEEGFSRVSIRRITRSAGVNLAAVNYHFGTKNALLRETFARHLKPLNEVRLQLLDRLEAEAGPRPLPVESILECLLGPIFRTFAQDIEKRTRFMRLMGRAFAEMDEEISDVVEDQLREVVRRFITAFSRSLPHLALPELFWRIHFTIGAAAHCMAYGHRVERLSGGLCDASDLEALLGRLIPYLASGLRARATSTDTEHRS